MRIECLSLFFFLFSFLHLSFLFLSVSFFYDDYEYFLSFFFTADRATPPWPTQVIPFMIHLSSRSLSLFLFQVLSLDDFYWFCSVLADQPQP